MGVVDPSPGIDLPAAARAAPLNSPSQLARPGFLALALLVSCSTEPEPVGPHVVVVTLDTFRFDHLGLHSDGVPVTPHLDEFAETALVHEAAFTTMPTTGPAHASLFTGLHPYQHGLRANGMSLRPEVATARSLPAKLHALGYRTGAFVTARVFGRDVMGLRGFEQVAFPRGAVGPDDAAVEEALAWLEDESERSTFLWVHLFGAHSPYGTWAEKQGHFPPDPDRYGWVDTARYADVGERQATKRLYANGVREVDAAFGRLVAEVRALLGSNVLFLVLADHGEFLDELLDSQGLAFAHGVLLGEPVLHIPMLVAGQGIAPARSAATVSIRDAYTTVLAAAGLDDSDAEREGRRDLRFSSPTPRFVLSERRVFSEETGRKFDLGPQALELIHGSRMAVTDGTDWIVLGADGERSDGRELGDEDLATVARRHWELLTAADEGSLELDEEARRVLEQLGYVK